MRPLPFETIRLSDDGRLCILDQRMLPGREEYIELQTAEDVWHAIKDLAVRGAPLIGVAAAYGFYISVKDIDDDFLAGCRKVRDYLDSSRPTAVNLAAALSRMERRFSACAAFPQPQLLDALRGEAEAIKAEDVAMCRSIAGYGAELIDRPGMGILTHCNAGHYAVSRYGTALAPIYLAHSRGLAPRVYADETRPLMQGARITAFELQKAGVDVTLECDSMASSLMASGRVDLVFTGCDRVACNGDTANKVGTSALAILARYYGIPFYILGPTSSIDPETACGSGIPVEQRGGEEVTDLYFSRRTAPEGVRVYNPAFDVTPSELITGIVTEKGIFRPPYDFTFLKLNEKTV